MGTLEKLVVVGGRNAPNIIACAYCGGPCHLTRSDKIYCSSRCRQRANREKRKAG